MGQKMSIVRILAGLFLILALLLSLGGIFAGSSALLDDEDEGDETETITETEITSEEDDNDEDEEKDDDDDGVDDDHESKTKRELKYEHSDDEFKIESELKTGENKDKFEVNFKLEDEPEIEFEYKSESDDVETKLELKIEFISLIEFDDSNGNGYLDENDTEYSTYEFEDVEFEDLELLVSTTSDGELLYQVWTQTTDGVFLIRMYLVGGFGTINGSVITPTEAKIDLEIHNYTYASQGDLALRLKLKTKVETEIEKNDDSPDENEGLTTVEEALDFMSSSGYLGFFSWVMTASVDGVEKPVVSGPYKALESETESEDDEDETEIELKQTGEIVLVYPHGIDIIHDPKLGVVTSTSYSYIATGESSTQSSIPGFLGLTTILMLVSGALLLFYRRKE